MYIKLINGFSNIKWVLTQTKGKKPKIFFRRKIKKISHPPLHFDNNIVLGAPYQKHLSKFLDAWLKFEEHLKVITTNVNKAMRLLWKVQKITDYGTNNYVQSFCEATSRLWQHYLWRSLERTISQEFLVFF